jgi:hypothetical protein
LLARIVQRRDLVGRRVNSGEVVAFVHVAIKAGETQIIWFISATMFHWDDVIHME